MFWIILSYSVFTILHSRLSFFNVQEIKFVQFLQTPWLSILDVAAALDPPLTFTQNKVCAEIIWEHTCLNTEVNLSLYLVKYKLYDPHS